MLCGMAVTNKTVWPKRDIQNNLMRKTKLHSYTETDKTIWLKRDRQKFG